MDGVLCVLDPHFCVFFFGDVVSINQAIFIEVERREHPNLGVHTVSAIVNTIQHMMSEQSAMKTECCVILHVEHVH